MPDRSVISAFSFEFLRLSSSSCLSTVRLVAVHVPPKSCLLHTPFHPFHSHLFILHRETWLWNIDDPSSSPPPSPSRRPFQNQLYAPSSCRWRLQQNGLLFSHAETFNERLDGTSSSILASHYNNVKLWTVRISVLLHPCTSPVPPFPTATQQLTPGLMIAASWLEFPYYILDRSSNPFPSNHQVYHIMTMEGWLYDATPQ